ncbi:MAG: hypothetical protein R3230_00810 [Nitrosopumilaceae archaeon]|nr:hypothetical protein [Nitrosopumilaceae archaeon]
MAIPLTRADFKEYCLKKLGKPVIRINVDDGQVEDRIDDAIQRFQEQHYDAVQETWLAYKITQADIDNGYLTISDDILIVAETLDISQTITTSDMFSYQYQVAIQNLSPFQTLDMINYFMTMTNINQITQMVNASPRVEHTRYMNRVEIYRDLSELAVDSVIALRVFKTIDPESYGKVYNDIWLKKYATALIKMQWGSNMKKHTNVELLGGVKVDGQTIFDEALDEISRLDEELESRYSEPVDFFVG